MSPRTASYRGRLIAAALLLVAALALAAAGAMLRAPGPSRVPPGRGGNAAAIDAAVERLLLRYGIPPQAVRTRRATAPGVPTGRLEETIHVDGEFPSLEFNHALQEAVAPEGGSVVATEHPASQSVAMHIVRDGVTIRTLRFVSGTVLPHAHH